MHFCIFSFNRGIFLQNCIASIEQCAPFSSVTIFDDNSSDKETKLILEQLSSRHTVWQPTSSKGLESKHGGLYNNMQAALELMPDNALMCFLQDDTQIVRSISIEEIDVIRAQLDENQLHGFIQPAFMRKRNAISDKKLTRFNPTLNMYYVDRYKRSAGAYYSDICIASVHQLRAVNWQFKSPESKNEIMAREHFEQLSYLKNPFAAWLPNVPAFRGKKESWSMRTARRLSNSGFYPIERMTSIMINQFVNRPKEELPYAEDFLTVKGGGISGVWNYYPLQGRAFLKKINQIEQALNL